MTTRRIFVPAVAAIALLFTPASASAGLIADRVALQTQLGAAAITEDFESWTSELVSDSPFTVLDADTVIAGQGPGIVNPGLRFTNIASNRNVDDLQLDRRSEFSIPSGSLLAEGGTLVIDFLVPITHAGFDFFQFDGFADTASVQVFASDDSTVIFQTARVLPAPNAPASTFFGYTDLGGIGSVRIRSTVKGWSPLVDDLTYGDIPEPASLCMLGLGALVIGCGQRGQRNTA